MSTTSFISCVNIYNFICFYIDVVKFLFDYTLKYCKSIYKSRNKFFRSNHFLILCILSLIFCLYINKRLNSNTRIRNQDKTIELFINRIRDIVILNQNYQFNITVNLNGIDLPKWLYQYKITHLFNFYWLQNGAYLWHLQRMMDFKDINRDKNFHQKISQNFNQTIILDYINHHPEYGIIIDTASDPIQSLFPLLPQLSLSFEEICEQYQSFPCNLKTPIISSFPLQSLITYALYDVTIDAQDQSISQPIHYDEIIFIFDSQQQIANEVVFVQQYLPRLIRLLALVPPTAVILIPYLNTKVYINQYMDILIQRELIPDRKRLIEYNSNQSYHSNVLYSTSSPRSDLILLNQILIGDKLPIRRELILIIRNDFDENSYNDILRTLNQFELFEYEYLHIYEYHEKLYDLKQIEDLFRQARIVIGMPTNILSHIVWCQPRTHIIEIFQKTMTKDYYEISLQLQFNYWIAMTTKTNQIDIVDFRNLMMKVLIDIDA